jgi:hypothetical protein
MTHEEAINTLKQGAALFSLTIIDGNDERLQIFVRKFAEAVDIGIGAIETMDAKLNIESKGE